MELRIRSLEHENFQLINEIKKQEKKFGTIQKQHKKEISKL